MVKDVFIFKNGNVAVTDENGKQMSELQGRWDDMAYAIIASCSKETLFYDQRAMSKEVEHLGLTLAGLMTNIEMMEKLLQDDTIADIEKINSVKTMINHIKSRVRI